MAERDNSDWLEYRMLILEQLKLLALAIKELTDKYDKMSLDVTALKTKFNTLVGILIFMAGAIITLLIKIFL